MPNKKSKLKLKLMPLIISVFLKSLPCLKNPNVRTPTVSGAGTGTPPHV